MTKTNVMYSCVALATLLFCSGGLPAQQAPSRPTSGAVDTAALNKPTFQSAVFNPDHKQILDFVIRVFGTVSGRVVANTDTTDSTQSSNQLGLAGVKITLRSRDAGFEIFKFEQFTDSNGMYTFQYLPPGKYWIEVDPTSSSNSY